MSHIMSAIASIFIALLGNERAVDYIIVVIERLRDKADNAIDDEYATLQQQSLKERVIDNKKPSDGNVFLEQDQIDQVKAARPERLTPEQMENLHEKV